MTQKLFIEDNEEVLILTNDKGNSIRHVAQIRFTREVIQYQIDNFNKHWESLKM